jgi:hypothetical protein
MDVSQYLYQADSGWNDLVPGAFSPELVLVFGGVDELSDPRSYQTVREKFPEARIILVSTAGEIAGTRVLDRSLVCTGIKFLKTSFRIAKVAVKDFPDSASCGRMLADELNSPDLCHLLIFSEGTDTNGDQLVQGLKSGVRPDVLITGGLAADAGRFERTYVGVDEPAREGRIAAVGFYGSNLQVAHGSQGGWDQFGPVRVVTRSEGNVLFELDGTSALELYKRYLGDKAKELPASALLFPLCILQGGDSVVRTILFIDESRGSMTFAGDIPEGAHVQFMMANFDRLIDGAALAAGQNQHRLIHTTPELVLMVSCVGRKLVLGPRIDEEVESVHEIFGDRPVYCGYYSNGEISPVGDNASCSLHNQTMTITTYAEINSDKS